MDRGETEWHDVFIIMPQFARVPRLSPPSPAARRVELGYVVLEAAIIAILVGLAVALVTAPIPERALHGIGRPSAGGASRVQTL